MGNNKNINIKNEDAPAVFRKLGIDPAAKYLMDVKRAIFKLYKFEEPELTIMAARKTLTEQRPNNAYGIKISDSEMKKFMELFGLTEDDYFQESIGGRIIKDILNNEIDSMKKKVISRYLSRETYEAVKKDFQFLIEKIKLSGFEYGLQIRDDYLNLYYKGNSLGKISYRKSKKLYKIKTHHKFAEGAGFTIRRFKHSREKEYILFTLESKQLHPFFSTRNLSLMAQKVKEVQFQEEIVFEQMLLTDNAERNDLIIIDRQVEDRNSSTKMDLLALKRNKAGKYQFCVLEVKLGNNPELKGKVFTQLNGYVERITKNFQQYKKCYEENALQKQELGLLPGGLTIDIVKGVLGFVVVGGYSGLAEQSIRELKERHPNIKVLHINNKINLDKAK